MEQNSLKVHGLFSLLKSVPEKYYKGIMVFKNGQSERRLYFYNKNITGAGSNDPADYLGQYLINQGSLDIETFNKAYRTQLETDVKMGAILNLIGLTPFDNIQQAIRDKIIDTAFLVYFWGDGTFEILHEYPVFSDQVETNMNPLELLDIVKIRQQEMNDIISMYNVLGSYPELSILDGESKDFVNIEHQIIKLFALEKSINEVISLLPVHFYMLSRHILSLFNKGVILPGKGQSLGISEIFSNMIKRTGLLEPQRLYMLSENEMVELYKKGERIIRECDYWKAVSVYRILYFAHPKNIVFRDTLKDMEYKCVYDFYKTVLDPMDKIEVSPGRGVITTSVEHTVYSFLKEETMTVREIVTFFKEKHSEINILAAIKRLKDKGYVKKSIVSQ